MHEFTNITNESEQQEQSEMELEQQQQQHQDAFFKQLFNVFDSDKLGYITVDNFINIFKQNIIDSNNDPTLADYYENKITEVVSSLDPNNLGRVDYSQFVSGMTKLLDDSDVNNNKSNEEIKSRRATFTFENSDKLEQTVDLLRLNYKQKQLNDFYDEDEIYSYEKSNYESSSNNNTLEETFEDDHTNNSPNKSRSSNETDNYDFIDEINNSDSELNIKKALNESSDVLDMFGLDQAIIINHRKSLSSNSTLLRHQFLQKKRLSMSDDVETKDVKTKNLNVELANYEELVQNLEKQIENLTYENESLKNEISEQMNRNKNLNNENLNLVEKLQGAEDHVSELERRSNYLLEEEKLKNQDILNKMYNSHIEEQTSYFSQLRNLEAQLNSLKSEHSVQLKQNEELKRNYEIKEAQLHKEESKSKKLAEKIEELNAQMNYLELENASKITQYDKQIKDLMYQQDEIQNELNTKETMLLNLQNNNFAVQNELSLRVKLEELEKENHQLKNEIEQLNSNMEIMNAQIYKNNLNDSIYFNFERIHEQNSARRKESTSKNESSFENEINTMSREELLNKLVQEQQMSARLKEYIDDLLPKIIEHCPKIFEIQAAQKKR